MHRKNIPCKEEKFYQVPCAKYELTPAWKETRPIKVAEKMISLRTKHAKENCQLTVGEYEKPTDKQSTLYVNDMERVGAKRTSYLDNYMLIHPRIGTLKHQLFHSMGQGIESRRGTFDF